MKTWKTPKGTELTLLDLRGKDYLQVQWRLVWFREEKPDWSIETELHINPEQCTAKATIKDEAGRIIATAHKHEDKQGFADYREKAETGAVGRALAFIGYGTQFCADELDEGERLADSPAERPKSRTDGTALKAAPSAPISSISSDLVCGGCGCQLKFTDKKQAYYCPNFKDKNFQHDYLTQADLDMQKKQDPFQEGRQSWEK